MGDRQRVIDRSIDIGFLTGYEAKVCNVFGNVLDSWQLCCNVACSARIIRYQPDTVAD